MDTYCLRYLRYLRGLTILVLQHCTALQPGYIPEYTGIHYSTIAAFFTHKENTVSG